MSRGAGRSFAVLVGMGAALDLGGAATALWGLATLRRCYAPNPSGSAQFPIVCMKPIAVLGFHLFVPVALLITLLVLTGICAVRQGARSFGDFRHLERSLGPVIFDLPPRLATAASYAQAKRVELRQDDTPYGACIGLLHPRVVVSTALFTVLDQAEIVAVLAHEERHRRRRAPLRRFLARLTAHSLFYMPILGDLFSAHLVDEEVVADQESLTLAGKSALVRALAKISGSVPGGDLALAFGDVSALSYRLRALQEGSVSHPPLDRRRLGLSLAALSGLVLLALWMPLSGVR